MGRRKEKESAPTVIDIDSCASPMSEKDESPIRSIFCLKTREKIREIEEKEDCFILDFDPDDISRLSVSRSLANVNPSPDLCVISEKGQVACRDYPHSRHVCLKYPFEKTLHENCCELCYCFVCDLAAPCQKWTGTSGHCHAIDNEAWRLARKALRNVVKASHR